MVQPSLGMKSGEQISGGRIAGSGMATVTQRKLVELGPKRSRKDVSTRKSMMQKKGLEREERVFVPPLAAGKEAGRVPGAPC